MSSSSDWGRGIADEWGKSCCPVLQHGSAVPSPRACGNPSIQQSPGSSEQRTKQRFVKCVVEQGGFMAEAEMEPGGSAAAPNFCKDSVVPNPGSVYPVYCKSIRHTGPRYWFYSSFVQDGVLGDNLQSQHTLTEHASNSTPFREQRNYFFFFHWLKITNHLMN